MENTPHEIHNNANAQTHMSYVVYGPSLLAKIIVNIFHIFYDKMSFTFIASSSLFGVC